MLIIAPMTTFIPVIIIMTKTRILDLNSVFLYSSKIVVILFLYHNHTRNVIMTIGV